ncbi:hypothetical protein LCM08_20790 [Salipiger pacificus]|nr:hypothetical protein [Alloyangia pacifica]
MSGNQKQNATDSSIAVQGGRDVTINQGITTEQMGEILGALSSHVDTLGGHAKAEIERRLGVLERSVLERFASDDTANKEAFSDPDFQAATLDAQKAFARSGDEDLKTVLVDLIAQRSKVSDRTRLSLTLNDAIQKVGVIPVADLNAMSVMFVFKNAHLAAAVSLHQVLLHLSTVAQCAMNFSSSQSALQYLLAHGCVTAGASVATYPDAFELISKVYPEAISKGVPRDTMQSSMPAYDDLVSSGYVGVSEYDPDFDILHIGARDLNRVLSQFGIFEDHSNFYSRLVKENLPSREEFIDVAEKNLPDIRNILDAYDAPMLRNSQLTSIGIALAHANIDSDLIKRADLSIWVKA